MWAPASTPVGGEPPLGPAGRQRSPRPTWSCRSMLGLGVGMEGELLSAPHQEMSWRGLDLLPWFLSPPCADLLPLTGCHQQTVCPLPPPRRSTLPPCASPPPTLSGPCSVQPVPKACGRPLPVTRRAPQPPAQHVPVTPHADVLGRAPWWHRLRLLPACSFFNVFILYFCAPRTRQNLGFLTCADASDESQLF